MRVHLIESARTFNRWRRPSILTKIDGAMKRLGNHSTRATETASTSSSENGVAAKSRMVLTRTVDKWIAENDRTLSTTTWLRGGSRGGMGGSCPPQQVEYDVMRI